MEPKIPDPDVFEATVEVEGIVIKGYASEAKFSDGAMKFLCYFGQLPADFQERWRGHSEEPLFAFTPLEMVVDLDKITIGDRVDPHVLEHWAAQRGEG